MTLKEQVHAAVTLVLRHWHWHNDNEQSFIINGTVGKVLTRLECDPDGSTIKEADVDVAIRIELM